MRTMRWSCEADGCFNQLMRLRLGVFDECFTETNDMMSDIDGWVHVGGRHLFLEWKTGATRPGKQQDGFKALSSLPGVAVFIVWGEPETMTVRGFRSFRNGELSAHQSGDIEALRVAFRDWYEEANTAE